MDCIQDALRSPSIAKELYRARNKHTVSWLATPKWILQKLDYLHLNPVRNGLVSLPEHYLYSSARQYVGEKVLLEVELIDLGSTYGYVDV